QPLYLPPELLQRFLSVVGAGQQAVALGVQLGTEPSGMFTEVAPDGPAARAGLQAGDVVLAADGKDLSHADTPSLAAALTGAGGSSVTLTVDRGGDAPLTVTATRGAYYFPP